MTYMKMNSTRQFLLVAILALWCGVAKASTPYGSITTLGLPPVCTSLANNNWDIGLMNFRDAESPVAQTTVYYDSWSTGSDSNPGTISQPFKTIAKANSVLAAASSGQTEVEFKSGDTWPHETETYSFTVSGSSPSTGQNSIVLNSTGVAQPIAGDTMTLTGGTQETLTVSYTAISTYNYTLTVYFTTNIANSGHTGATWTGLSSIDIVEPSESLTCYGSPNAPLPEFDAFTGGLVPSSFSNYSTRGDGYGRVYSTTEKTPIAAFREVGDHRIWRQVFSIQQCDVIPGSWFQAQAIVSSTVTLSTSSATIQVNNAMMFPSSGTLYLLGTAVTYTGTTSTSFTGCTIASGSLYVYGSVSSGQYFGNVATGGTLYVDEFSNTPLTSSGRTYECAFNNRTCGVQIENVDHTRIDSLDIEGYGASCNFYSGAYDIKGSVNGTNSAIVSRCTALYGGNHEIGILGNSYGANSFYTPDPTAANGSAVGGIITYYQDTAGCSTQGDTPFVGFQTNGGYENLLWECRCVNGFVPVGACYNSTGVAYTSHSGYIVYSTPVQGQSTITVTGPGLTNVYLPAGIQVTLPGTTPETLTVSSYNSSTGLLTFATNIQQSGHGTTQMTYASGSNSGSFVAYNCSLCLLYKCSNEVGPYQPCSVFGGPQNTPGFTDLVNCRSWDYGETYRCRAADASDANVLQIPLTSGSQGTTTVTVTNPAIAFYGSAGGYIYQSVQVTLSGGSSAPEDITISSVNTSTGVITFTTNIVGSGRTMMEMPLGAVYNQAAGSVLNGGLNNSPNTANINGVFECRQYYEFPNIGGSSFVYQQGPNSSCQYINCNFLLDWTGVTDPSNGYQNRQFYPTATYAPQFYNCRFDMRVSGRDLGNLFSTGSYYSQSASPVIVMNSVITGYGAENGVCPGIGNNASNQINNAYGGMLSGIKSTTFGWSNDPYPVELPYIPAGHPDLTSPLLSIHNQLIDGEYILQFDREGKPRSTSTPAIGDLEPLSASTVPGRGRILN